MKTNNPVGWFEIYVDELERAKSFYEQVFNLKLDKLPMDGSAEMGNIQMLSFPMEMDGKGTSGALVKMDGFKAGGNSTIVYFTSEDCSIEEKRIDGAGGKIQQAKMSIGQYGFIVLAVDTEGNMIGVHSQK